MAGKAGRPNKYYTHVEPNLDKIAEMALTMSEEQIAKSLGVGYTAWKNYKRQYPSINAQLQKGRQNLVMELKGALIKKAKGFQYQETKVIKESGIIVREEVTTKTSPPDVAAANLLLKNYDRDNWSNDWQNYELRKKELELKEKKMQEDDWG